MKKLVLSGHHCFYTGPVIETSFLPKMHDDVDDCLQMGFDGKFYKRFLNRRHTVVIKVILFPIISLKIILEVKRPSIETENIVRLG